MSRQGAGTSVPAPLAYPGGCAGVVCGVAGVACAVGPGLWTGLLGVPVGGGLSACCLLPQQIFGRGAACPPASRPRRELRSARLVAVCCPAGPTAAHGHSSLALSIAQDSHPVVTSHIPEPTPNFACNSPTILSNIEIRSLELRRFQTLLKLRPIELHASFLRGGRMGAAGGVAGARKPGVRLSGTGVAFAGEKWVFFVRFSVAEVLSVSVVVVEG